MEGDWAGRARRGGWRRGRARSRRGRRGRAKGACGAKTCGGGGAWRTQGGGKHRQRSSCALAGAGEGVGVLAAAQQRCLQHLFQRGGREQAVASWYAVQYIQAYSAPSYSKRYSRGTTAERRSMENQLPTKNDCRTAFHGKPYTEPTKRFNAYNEQARTGGEKIQRIQRVQEKSLFFLFRSVLQI